MHIMLYVLYIITDFNKARFFYRSNKCIVNVKLITIMKDIKQGES